MEGRNGPIGRIDIEPPSVAATLSSDEKTELSSSGDREPVGSEAVIAGGIVTCVASREGSTDGLGDGLKGGESKGEDEYADGIVSTGASLAVL